MPRNEYQIVLILVCGSLNKDRDFRTEIANKLYEGVKLPISFVIIDVSKKPESRDCYKIFMP